MWGSMFIGDEYDIPLSVADEFSNDVLKSLAQHPYFQPQQVPLNTLNIVKSDKDAVSRFAKNGDGWFETAVGEGLTCTTGAGFRRVISSSCPGDPLARKSCRKHSTANLA